MRNIYKVEATNIYDKPSYLVVADDEEEALGYVIKFLKEKELSKEYIEFFKTATVTFLEDRNQLGIILEYRK